MNIGWVGIKEPCAECGAETGSFHISGCTVAAEQNLRTIGAHFNRNITVSANNGVVRVSRKGLKKFAFGEVGTPGSEPFEVDVVLAWQDWLNADEGLREEDDSIADWSTYHQAAIDFVLRTSAAAGVNGVQVTTAEALDFIARLRECYDDLAVFFRPRSREERGLQGTSEGGRSSTSEQKTELRFAEEVS